jgi:nitroreductase
MPQFERVLTERRSIRAFDPARSVPRETILRALTLAQQSPSNCNAQPWRVFVVGGERCRRLRDVLVDAVEQAVPPDEATTPAFTGRYRELQVDCAVQLYTELGIDREDRPARARAELRNFEFFDAPHVAVLCMQESFPVGVAIDVGIYLQSLLLAFEALGVSTCAQASLRRYATLIKRELEIDPSLRVMCGVSFGYALPGAPVNRVRQARSGVEENVTLLGFDSLE